MYIYYKSVNMKNQDEAMFQKMLSKQLDYEKTYYPYMTIIDHTVALSMDSLAIQGSYMIKYIDCIFGKREATILS